MAQLGKGCRTLTLYHLDFDRLCTTFKKVHSPPSKFLLQLCLLKWPFCCLFFFRGSVISLLLLMNHSLTKALNCSSSSAIFGTFCTELTTAASTTSFMWIETNWRPSCMNRFPISSRERNNETFTPLVNTFWKPCFCSRRWWPSAEDMLP